jgi:MoxR-like ATPase
VSPPETAAELRALETELERAAADLAHLRPAIGQAFLGHEDVVDALVWALLAGGHVLLEGVPGLGKTTLAKALAAALGMDFARISFTPDLMPGDILGLRVLEEDAAGRRSLRLHRGPVFAHVVLADEINRATPRTQSALLEAMAERQVTLFGETLALPDPFLLIATQNPIELEGTWPLPEAQLDRFTFKVTLGLPSAGEIARVLNATSEAAPKVPAVLDAARLVRLRELVRRVPTSDDIVMLVARLVRATQPLAPEAPESVRTHLRHGASPRGAQAVLWTARARAFCAGRLFVTREDVAAVAAPALRHRLIPSYEGEAAGFDPDALIAAALTAAGAR